MYKFIKLYVKLSFSIRVIFVFLKKLKITPMKKLTLLLIAFLCMQTLVAQKNVAIYWDASYSMKDRILERELQYLDNYFKKYTEATVTLVMFSNEELFRHQYTISKGDWSPIKRELENTIYDGGTSYLGLFKDKVDEYLLFSDGIGNMSKLKPPTDKPIHIVSSVVTPKTTDLKLIADLSSGRYVYLNNDLKKQFTQSVREDLVSGDDDGFVTGKVYGVEGDLPNVSVVNQSNGSGAASNSRGDYRIKADEGDILVFSYLGKKTVSVRVARADIINIGMANINEALDEVVLEAQVEKEELVNTGNEEVDKKRLGYSVETIGEDDISALDTDVQQAVKGQFSNFFLPNDTAIDNVDLSQFLGRGRNMSILLNQYGLIVVDGVPQEQSDSEFGGIKSNISSSLNPDIIASITYLKGLAATNKYGTLGRNGVLLITTKNSLVTKTDNNKPDKPLGTTATYSGNAAMVNKLPDTPYILALKASKNVDEAFEVYLKQREKFGNDPVFYFDACDYFKGWNNPLLSKRILSNVYELAFNDESALRALAYKQQEEQLYKDALLTLQRLIRIQPKHSQPYRDLALVNQYSGNYQDALDIYNRIDNNRNVGSANFTGIRNTINNDARNLIGLHGSTLNKANMNTLYSRPLKYKSRIIFEWNEMNAEFDLSIINPQNRYFTWSHTSAENSQRILQQHQQGYGLEEFYLTTSDVGEWKFNMKYYGNKTATKRPTYIKITIYKDFGSQSQTKTIKVVRLSDEDIEQTVAKLLIK